MTQNKLTLTELNHTLEIGLKQTGKRSIWDSIFRDYKKIQKDSKNKTRPKRHPKETPSRPKRHPKDTQKRPQVDPK